MDAATQRNGGKGVVQNQRTASFCLNVSAFIEKHKLLDSNELYLVALSGGADSVALLLVLAELGFRVEAVHCNFHLRGEESERDEQFCVSLCQQLGVVLHRVHFDTMSYAELHKVSIEMAARELRYRYFEQLRCDVGAQGICVAHHRDDSVETIVLNLVRGTGLRGLTGIKPRHGRVLRPLLCVTRRDIEAFLQARGQAYVTDSTNLEADVLRNKVRLQVMPLLRQLNAAAAENILRTAENLSEAQRVLDGILEQYDDEKELDLNKLAVFGSSEYIVFEWLKKFGFNGKQVAQVLAAETGAVLTSPAGYDVLKDRGRLVVEESPVPMKPLKMPEEGVYLLGENLRLRVERRPAYVSKNSHSITLDASKVQFPLLVRRAEAGDWMIPFGMKGRKLLSDLMTDRKMSLFEKRRQLVVTDATGKVVWLVGVRTDERCRVEDSTAQVLVLSCEQ